MSLRAFGLAARLLVVGMAFASVLWMINLWSLSLPGGRIVLYTNLFGEARGEMWAMGLVVVGLLFLMFDLFWQFRIEVDEELRVNE